MTQDDVAQKILAELLELSIIEEKDEDITWVYLQQAYAAGYDEGRIQYTHRKAVGQYSMEGKLIKIWESCIIASRAFQVDKTSISKAALGKTETCAGFRWEYINLTKPISETQKIGRGKLGSARPTPRTRVSKTGLV